MRKSDIFIVCFALTIIILLAACTDSKQCPDTLGCVTIAPGEPIEIEVMQVLSGELAVQGLMQVHGIKMSLTKKDNHLLGHPVLLHIEDSGCSTEGGVTAALSLTKNPQIVGIIGTYCSSSATAAINDGDRFTIELTKEFERKFKELGGEIVRSVGINK